jgi:hypothetical protein
MLIENIFTKHIKRNIKLVNKTIAKVSIDRSTLLIIFGNSLRRMKNLKT